MKNISECGTQTHIHVVYNRALSIVSCEQKSKISFVLFARLKVTFLLILWLMNILFLSICARKIKHHLLSLLNKTQSISFFSLFLHFCLIKKPEQKRLLRYLLLLSVAISFTWVTVFLHFHMYLDCMYLDCN